uniref:TAP binding protein like n=1 Tax=Nothobranchius furzeri TaxID=105023 RepID=A0A8C6K589_NOTFU
MVVRGRDDGWELSAGVQMSSSPDIPNAEVLLHADCNEQEVTCEISRYTPRGLQESSDPAYFMVFLSVEGLDFSMSLILQTLSVEKHQPALIQKKLSLPLSSSGTLQTKGIFLVFSNKKSVLAPLRGDILLNCGFKQEEVPLGADVGVEWRLQHRGKGHKVDLHLYCQRGSFPCPAGHSAPHLS